ncbi:hypothetical protein M408DRAFT_330179 [Serendipita vermifera MAFF 305830]|uniref:Protein BIG1 n=1 Tax=Serendipita vermifera MAFF 305830 TaxID=933852 RepID=A0A0C3B538_SERVB|nr:hypothetical protein M408DRAFT_330179 [Serendipita vermifera MAFF 305830]
MLALVLFSLVSLSSALSPVPLLGYTSTSFPFLESVQTNDQATAINTIFDHEDICSFDAIILATQEALHATKLKSTYSSVVDRYRSAESGIHLPYLSYSVSPIEQAADLAVRCNSKLLHAPTTEDASFALDVSQKHVITLEFEEIVDPETVDRQLATFMHAFPSHLTLFTGVPGRSRRQSTGAKSSGSIPAPDPTPSAPLAPVSYRVLTPTLIFSFGIVFGLVVPLVYIAISALGGIKSPVSNSSYKGPSADKKNR